MPATVTIAQPRVQGSSGSARAGDMKVGLTLAVMGVLGCTVIVSPAVGATYKRVGSASASGDYAMAIATGEAQRPAGIYVSVVASPRQRVSVHWTLVCSKGMGAGSKSGDYTTSSSAKRKLRMPMSNADSCIVSASGDLGMGSGKISVRIYRG